MLFFDDEETNVKQVRVMGMRLSQLLLTQHATEPEAITCHLVAEMDPVVSRSCCMQVARLGVTAVHVHSSAGMTLQALGDGLQLYADAHKSS